MSDYNNTNNNNSNSNDDFNDNDYEYEMRNNLLSSKSCNRRKQIKPIR